MLQDRLLVPEDIIFNTVLIMSHSMQGQQPNDVMAQFSSVATQTTTYTLCSSFHPSA